MSIEVRRARPEDESDVVAFTQDTWPDRGGDYLPRVFADWVTSDDENQRTLVAEMDGAVVGIVQCVLLTDHEAWMQGLRVAPTARGRGLSRRLSDAAAKWARARGAIVARNMVFSSNDAGMAVARAAGFEPVSAFRWVHPAPNASAEPACSAVDDANAAWAYWERSAARDHLRGLALAPNESWALCELTDETLAWAADATFLTAFDDAGIRGLSFRVRDFERADDDGTAVRWAEYGVAAWTDLTAARAVLATVSRDAASIDADRTRVLVPETVGAVSDAARAGAAVADEPDYVFELDLTRR